MESTYTCGFHEGIEEGTSGCLHLGAAKCMLWVGRESMMETPDIIGDQEGFLELFLISRRQPWIHCLCLCSGARVLSWAKGG